MTETLHIFLNGVVGVFGVIFVLYLCIRIMSLIVDKFEVEKE